MAEIGLRPVHSFLYGLFTFLIICLRFSSKADDLNQTADSAAERCNVGPAAGDCLQVIFHRYGNANSITFGRFREFVHNIGLGFTETDAEHDHHQHSNGATGTAKPSTLTDPFSSMFGDKHTTDAHVQEVRSLFYHCMYLKLYSKSTEQSHTGNLATKISNCLEFYQWTGKISLATLVVLYRSVAQISFFRIFTASLHIFCHFRSCEF